MAKNKETVETKPKEKKPRKLTGWRLVNEEYKQGKFKVFWEGGPLKFITRYDDNPQPETTDDNKRSR